MPPNAPRADGPEVPARLIRLLETTAQRLRNLARLDPKVDPFTGSGAACEYVEEICCDLERRGFHGAAQELRRRGAAVTEAATTIVLPQMCKGDLDEIAEVSGRLGLPPVFDSDALQVHVMAFVGALGLMADYVDEVCDDLKEVGGQSDKGAEQESRTGEKAAGPAGGDAEQPATEPAATGVHSYTNRLDDWASWVQDIALHVRRWVVMPLAMKRFRSMVRQAAAEPSAGDPVFGPKTLPQTYLGLAAIHDEVLEGLKIDPWQSEPPDEKRKVTEGSKGMFYYIVRRSVRNVRYEHRVQIEANLLEVKGDLASIGVVQAPTAQERQTGESEAPAAHKDKLPVWERLQITDSNHGDGQVLLDGKSRRVRSEAALKLLTQLQARKGDTVLGCTLEDLIGDRPDRAYKKLPKPLQKLIEKPGRGAKGYRLKN